MEVILWTSISSKENIMTQPLYTKQDNQDLNAQIESTVKMATIEVDSSGQAGRGLTSTEVYIPESELPEAIQHARGEQPSIIHIDDFAFFPAGQEEVTAQKIQQSSTFGTMNHKPSFTEGGINVTAPATPDFQLDPAMVRAAQAQLQEGGAVVLGQDGSSQMFSNIKDMFASKVAAPAKKETFFVNHQAKASFSIDRTIFEPSAIVRLSGKNFEAKYLAQLESYIYNGKDELEPDNLFAIIFIAGLLKEGKFPLKLITGKHRIQLPKIINVFNTFFNKNYSVIMGIYTMFNGMQVQQPQAAQKAE